jgi:hypothetical protein
VRVKALSARLSAGIEAMHFHREGGSVGEHAAIDGSGSR